MPAIATFPAASPRSTADGGSSPAGQRGAAQAPAALMFRSARNVLRLLRIAGTLARYDALFPLEQLRIAPGLVWAARRFALRRVQGRPGERLAEACQQLGPSFIKLGQALSVRSDLVGEDIAADLIQLQDRLPAFPGDVARAIVERELEQPIEALSRRRRPDRRTRRPLRRGRLPPGPIRRGSSRGGRGSPGRRRRRCRGGRPRGRCRGGRPPSSRSQRDRRSPNR